MHDHHASRDSGFATTALSLRLALSCCLLIVPALATGTTNTEPVGETPRAVPATFIKEIGLPGQGDTILRPGAIHHDDEHGELLVADNGHNRVLVFSESGIYRFEFSLGEAVSAVRDIETDPEGYIYVLGSIPGRRIVHRFDFDGLSLGTIPLPRELDGAPLVPRSLACDSRGDLYLLDERELRICRFTVDGRIADSFSLEPGLHNISENEAGLGPMTIAGDQILVPAAMVGTVLRFTVKGEFLGNIGFKGNAVGTLNFPVAVETTPEGLILVVDKHRYCIAAFDESGRFLGEFGGKGYRPGWFFHPSLLAVPDAGRVVVGQIFQNRIQICALPTFIREGATGGAESRAAREGDEVSSAVSGSDPGDTLQRRSSEHPQRITSKAVLGISFKPINVSLSEVSE